MLHATICFWTTESLDLMSVLTNGGVECGQYPLSICAAWFRRFSIFVVPLACMLYFPLLAILGRDDPLGSPPWFQWTSPLAGVAFRLLALPAFRLGVRRHTSTAS